MYTFLFIPPGLKSHIWTTVVVVIKTPAFIFILSTESVSIFELVRCIYVYEFNSYFHEFFNDHVLGIKIHFFRVYLLRKE